jgi:hypothetical protein
VNGQVVQDFRDKEMRTTDLVEKGYRIAGRKWKNNYENINLGEISRVNVNWTEMT